MYINSKRKKKKENIELDEVMRCMKPKGAQ